MFTKMFVVVAVAGVSLLTPARADAACCDQQKSAHHGDCCEMACCKSATTVPEPSAAEVFLSMDPQLNPAPPVRQLAEVWFQRPVLVGRSILQGRYIIEHDNDRMARGEPCTLIYAYHDRTTPVAAFHCTHLERDHRAHSNIVVLETISGDLQKLTEFQFSGETAAHGVPAR